MIQLKQLHHKSYFSIGEHARCLSLRFTMADDRSAAQVRVEGSLSVAQVRAEGSPSVAQVRAERSLSAAQVQAEGSLSESSHSLYALGRDRRRPPSTGVGSWHRRSRRRQLAAKDGGGHPY